MRKLREKMDSVMFKVRSVAADSLTKKSEGIDGFVVTIIIVAVAIAAGFVFRTQIINFINTFFAEFTAQAQALF